MQRELLNGSAAEVYRHDSEEVYLAPSIRCDASSYSRGWRFRMAIQWSRLCIAVLPRDWFSNAPEFVHTQ
jgi:hypothetical protein